MLVIVLIIQTSSILRIRGGFGLCRSLLRWYTVYNKLLVMDAIV